MSALVNTIQAALAERADPQRAPDMQRYMKTDMPFYGVAAADRVAIVKSALKQHPPANQDSYQADIRKLWQGNRREDLYAALEVAEQSRKFRKLEAFQLFEELMFACDWWDTLDWVAARLISPLMLKHSELEARIPGWRQHNSLWVRRGALLAQLKHMKALNHELLSESIRELAHERDFFIRKAIGWVLREYSKFNPLWVQNFVEQHRKQLSPLSIREALKRLK